MLNTSIEPKQSSRPREWERRTGKRTPFIVEDYIISFVFVRLAVTFVPGLSEAGKR